MQRVLGARGRNLEAAKWHRQLPCYHLFFRTFKSISTERNFLTKDTIDVIKPTVGSLLLMNRESGPINYGGKKKITACIAVKIRYRF